jgi:phage shock protein PspC (stress-responsive transcriptional regulator)
MILMKTFQIARAGKKLFDLSGQEVVNALASGAVLPTDDYWTHGMSGWEKVSTRSNWTTPGAQANPPHVPASSAAAPGPTQVTRKGKVLDFNVAKSYGLISGDDGIRYNFSGAEWRTQGTMPAYGVRVEFVSLGATASAIYAVASAGQHPTSGPGRGSSIYEGYYRSSDDQFAAGICAGLAHKWGKSNTAVRLVFFLFLPFATWFLYPILWLAWQETPTKNVP